MDPPVSIRALQSDQILELTWNEGAVTPASYRILRGECPCAVCRDEWTGARIFDANTIRDDLKIEGLEAVGSYAVRIAWSDGHSSGLYTWENLRRLADDSARS